MPTGTIIPIADAGRMKRKVRSAPKGRAVDVKALAEVRALLSRLGSRLSLCAAIMYGSGLRVSETVALRVKDVDFDRREIIVREGKGDKDRRTPLAESCAPLLERWIRAQLPRFGADLRAEVRTTGLSAALERKYPNAASEWRWRYVFAATRTFKGHSARAAETTSKPR